MVTSLFKGFVDFVVLCLLRLPAFPSERSEKDQGLAKPLRATTAAFLNVNTRYRGQPNQLNKHANYWWESCGHTLAVLLEKAGYPDQIQHQHLEFIRIITPHLGPSHVPGRQQHWKSFMTDDHTPIELSWDWRTGNKLPKIRFSIEPVGLHAGTPLDPDNQSAASRLQETLSGILSEKSMEWLRHFQEKLDGPETRTGAEEVEGHRSRQFYAFDLEEDGSIMSKAYFFPGFKARKTHQSTLDVIMVAIKTAPASTPEELQALEVFREFTQDASSPFEINMLAIDLVAPADSRFKIYFRIRDTSFASVINTIHLNNRLRYPTLNHEVLRNLYFSLLDRPATVDNQIESDDVQLPVMDHRTAGILYNVEFRYQSKVPKVKVYLPVRHYSQNEAAVMQALDAHFNGTESSTGQRDNMLRYKDAIGMIL
ncbi:hypothetical protein Daus18300_002303 [Diaporthe australafricana]|uniref:Aromatic prenyltransferase n=1 Tax=Diaporthe australafricana TaxID=127596 RepID=A0ABR3XQF0_9PEZI